MNPGHKEKPGQDDPGRARSPDFDAIMDVERNGPGSLPRRLCVEDLRDPAKAEEVLASWDELDPALLAAIEAHPHHGPRLAMLRKAELWLQKGGASMDPSFACPAVGELYDYGRGPGYGPLSSSRRAEIERHLIRCRDCDASVETLATPPPLPLDSHSWSPSLNRVPSPSRPAQRTPSPILREPLPGQPSAKPGPRALPRLVPLAIAASLILALGMWIAFVPSGPEALAFPKAPLLRGSSGGPLYFPRERNLEVAPEVAEVFPALRGEICFEVEPQEDASAYVIVLSRHGGDAFAAEEEVLLQLSSEVPMVRATLDLDPGSYTWTARAVVRGIDRELGARDFEIVKDSDLDRELAGLSGTAEPDRSLKAVRLLHERGFVSDARAIARTMPKGPERDAYLGQVPGR